MTQFEQENDFGRGGGEVDDETMEAAWKAAAERRGTTNPDEGSEREQDEAAADEPQPWAKASSGDADEA